jgi:hypothetical protein
MRGKLLCSTPPLDNRSTNHHPILLCTLLVGILRSLFYFNPQDPGGICEKRKKFISTKLKDQSTRKKYYEKVIYSESSWKICFYGILWIVVVFEWIAFEITHVFVVIHKLFWFCLLKNQFLHRFFKFSSNEYCSNFL